MIKDLGKYVIMFFVLILVQVLILNNISDQWIYQSVYLYPVYPFVAV